MGTVILIVMAHVYSGQSIEFQEFNSLQQCNHAAKIIMQKTTEDSNSWGIQSAFCVYK